VKLLLQHGADIEARDVNGRRAVELAAILGHARAASKAKYRTDPDKKKAASRAASKAKYSTDPEKKKAASRAASKAKYSTDPEKKKAASNASYSADPQKKKAASKAHYAKNPTAKIESAQAYYANNKESRCANRKARYALVDSKREVQEQYVKEILGHLFIKSEARVQLIAAFKRQQKTKMPRVMHKAVCRIAAKRLLNKLLKLPLKLAIVLTPQKRLLVVLFQKP